MCQWPMSRAFWAEVHAFHAIRVRLRRKIPSFLSFGSKSLLLIPSTGIANWTTWPTFIIVPCFCLDDIIFCQDSLLSLLFVDFESVFVLFFLELAPVGLLAATNQLSLLHSFTHTFCKYYPSKAISTKTLGPFFLILNFV